MAEIDKLEVRFDIYCEKCKYAKESEEFDPCDSCLAQPWNYNSEKPVNYIEAK